MVAVIITLASITIAGLTAWWSVLRLDRAVDRLAGTPSGWSEDATRLSDRSTALGDALDDIQRR